MLCDFYGKKEENEYFSLSYLLNEWIEYKKLDLQSSTILTYKSAFNIFKSLFGKWLHLISEEDTSKCITHCKTTKASLW